MNFFSLNLFTNSSRFLLATLIFGYIAMLLSAAGSHYGVAGVGALWLFFLLSSGCTATIFLVSLFTEILQGHSSSLISKWLTAAALCYFAAVSLSAAFFISTTPAFAWDFLNYWSLEIVRPIVNVDAIALFPSTYEPQKHPWGVSGFLTSILSFLPSTSDIRFFWLALLLLNTCCLKVIVDFLQLDLIWLFIAFFIQLVPLAENHYSIFGYVESVLCLGVNLFFCVFFQACRTKSIAYLCLAFLLSLSLAFIKTSGFIFCAICLGACLGALLTRFNLSHNRVLVLGCVACTAMVAASVTFTGSSFSGLASRV